jgi:hypothetical protein
MTNQDKLIFFLSSQVQTNEVVDLMRAAKGIETRIPMHRLVEYVALCKREAEIEAKQPNAQVHHLQNYLNWQRLLDFICEEEKPNTATEQIDLFK